MRKIRTNIKRGLAVALMSALVVSSFAGCGSKDAKKDDDTKVTADNEDLDELEGAVGKKVKEYDGYLGYGYDVLRGGYFNEDGIGASNCIIDMDSLAAAGYVREAKSNKTALDYFYSSKISDFYEKFQSKTFGMADFGFKGILGEFGCKEETFAYNDQFMILSNCLVRTKRELIDGASAKLLKDYLTENFKDDVDKLSGEEILQKYGSFVLTDIQVGGRLSIFFYLKDKGIFTEDKLSGALALYFEEKGVKADENGIDISGYDEASLKEAMTYIKTNATVSIRAYGGDVNLSSTNIDEALNSFADFQKSVKEGNTAFVDATNGMPVWELAEAVNADKATEIKNAFYGIEEEEKPVEPVSGEVIVK